MATTLMLEDFTTPHFWGFESHGKDEEGNTWTQVNKIGLCLPLKFTWHMQQEVAKDCHKLIKFLASIHCHD